MYLHDLLHFTDASAIISELDKLGLRAPTKHKVGEACNIVAFFMYSIL